MAEPKIKRVKVEFHINVKIDEFMEDQDYDTVREAVFAIRDGARGALATQLATLGLLADGEAH